MQVSFVSARRLCCHVKYLTVVSLATVIQANYHTTVPYNQKYSQTTQIRSCAMTSTRKADSLWGLFIADALAMPVHWYYNPNDIKTSYGGWLTGYVAPNKKHPSSILTLSAVDGSGRNGWHSKAKQIIGEIILHDKLKFWTSRDRSVHYHQGMSGGDSTLNALTALETMKTLQKVDPELSFPPRDVRAAVMENYVRFMTTPSSHNDTYAESFHRLFFREWANQDRPFTDGSDILKFCEERYSKVGVHNEDHQIPVIGSLVLAVPWVLHYADRPADQCAKLAMDAIKCTHPAPSLQEYINLYARLLHKVLNGKDLKSEVFKTLQSSAFGGSRTKEMIEKLSHEAARYPKGSENRLRVYQDATARLGSACYIQGAMASMLFLAQEFHDDFEAGVLMNANCGGENAHRGAALGALLAANAANQNKPIPQHLKDGLHSARDQIQQLLKSVL